MQTQAEAFYWADGVLTLNVRLQPNASSDEITGITDGRLKIRLTSPPLDNRANRHLVKYLAKQLGVAKSSIEIISGEHSRLKTLRIRSLQQLPSWLQPA